METTRQSSEFKEWEKNRLRSGLFYSAWLGIGIALFSAGTTLTALLKNG